MTHTPGPWNAESGYTPRSFAREHSLRIFAEDPGPSNDFHIGYVTDVDHATRKANADLIKSAPELLEALKEAQQLLENLWQGDYAGRPLAIKIQKAIDRAEGLRP